MPVRKEYIADLEKLKVDVQKMGELAKDSARNAITALVQRDRVLASRIIKENITIDDLEFDIENRCMKLIALQQPMAVDLRTIGTCMKIITDFDTGEIKKLENFSERDDVIDALFDQVRRELITITIEKPRFIANASHLNFVALHLERIGDHACNIASRIIYMVTGKRRKLD
jgi:phosphate transport system protein